MKIREATEKERATFTGWEFDIQLGMEPDARLLVAQDADIVGYLLLWRGAVIAVESISPGAGRALVSAVQKEHDRLEACAVSPDSYGFWERMGFEEGAFEDDGSWFWRRA